MTSLAFVTTNRGKFASAQRALQPLGVSLVQHAVELLEPQSLSLEEIAQHKAFVAARALGSHTALIVQDTGFYLDAYPGFPGTFVKFALEGLGVRGLLRLAEGNRRCEFRDCVVFRSEFETSCFLGDPVRGVLAHQPRGQQSGEQWSDLWLLFIPEGQIKTLAEMTDQECAVWRARREGETALGKFAKYWKSRQSQ